MKKTILFFVAFALFITGCSFKEENSMIANQNMMRQKAFAEAMTAAAKTESQADDVAIAMSYAGGIGMHQFFRPETPLDYAKGIFPFLTSWANLWISYNGGDSQDSDITAGRDVYINSGRNTVGHDITSGGSTNVDFSQDNSVQEEPSGD